VVSQPVRVSIRRTTAPSPVYSAPPAALIAQVAIGKLAAGPGPPGPPATVVIVPGAGPPVRAGVPGGAALPEANSHAVATPAATITAAPSARSLPCLRSRPHQPVRALLDRLTTSAPSSQARVIRSCGRVAMPRLLG
jgi:hypothetical protein